MNSKKSKRRPSRGGHVVQPRRVQKQLHHFWTTLGFHGPSPRGLHPYSADLPSSTGNLESFAIEYLVSEWFSKFDDGKSSDQKTATTWERFYQAEEICRVTNENLSQILASKEFFTRSSVCSLLWTAKRKIQGLLGPFCWNEASLHFGHGPGATTRLPRSRAHKVYKYSGRPETTIGNACLAHAAIMQKGPLWNEGLEFREDIGYCEIVPGNRVVTVPKNYKTDRTIAIEPDMNIYIQKGIGGVIRGRLRRAGVNLNSQSKNQELARIGSIDGSLATIDLSMASDTVCTVLVRHLLPPDWLAALEQCRSPSGVLPSGERVVYQKFSSMGNGFTFELESLIFWALVQTCFEHLRLEDRRFAVYGDDIIVPTACVSLLVDTLTVCGFTTNRKKTHVSGRFRESCGKHFLNGADVTPFYVRREVNSLRDLFLLHNNIRRWAYRAPLSDERHAAVEEFLLGLREIAPRKWRRPRIPDGMGDGAFIGHFDECTPTLAFEFLERGFEGYSIQVLADVSQIVEVDCTGRLVWSLDEVQGSFAWTHELPIRERVGLQKPPRIREVMTLVPLFPERVCYRSVSVN